MIESPIFIGGLDRTGKTLLRLMLSSHPNIAIARRTYLWTKFYNRYGDLSNPGNFERCLADILALRSMRIINPNSKMIRKEFESVVPTYGNLFAIIYRQYAARLGKSRWGDQLALIEHYTDEIFSAYPAAKIIHMVRDPRQRYIESMSSYSKIKGRLGWDIARWQHSAELAVNNRKKYSQSYIVVPYEALIDDREQTLRDVCDFLGEKYFPSMLLMDSAVSFSEEEDREQQVDDKNGKPESWRLSQSEIAFVQSYLRQSMEQFGYSMELVDFSFGDRLKFSVLDYPLNSLGAVAWRALESNHPT